MTFNWTLVTINIKRIMNISVFGLGYVGVVTAACLAEEGHQVIGVDVASSKVDLVNAGETPIIEERIGDMVKGNVANGRLSATQDIKGALQQSEMAIVCVGTPSRSDGSLNQEYIRQVVAQIGEELREREESFLVVMRSTMVPGTIRDLVLPTLEEHSGKKLGHGYEVVFHPEFLRESTSVYDFYNPPKIVVGECSEGSGAKLLKIYTEKFDAPRVVCGVEVAEMVKYCDNLFHAVKVTFGNEVGQFCHAHGINSQEVMDIFCQDRKLNISHRYLKPGFAFGGSCLPKDLRAFLSVAREKSVQLPMLEGVLPSNNVQIERCLTQVLAAGKKRIGFHGIAFKAGTDDLRESPYVELAERLLGKGCELTFFDKFVDVSRLVGKNKSYIEQVFPHLADMVTGDLQALDSSELILLCHQVGPATLDLWLETGKVVIDLTGAFSASERVGLDCVV
jgi:GDP-mannose 6-dehydrogenase